MGIVQLDFDYKAINQLFYCIFFAASGAVASMALLKKGGKLVVVFAILAAVLAAFQNGVALAVGKFYEYRSINFNDDWKYTYDWWTWECSIICTNSS